MVGVGWSESSHHTISPKNHPSTNSRACRLAIPRPSLFSPFIGWSLPLLVARGSKGVGPGLTHFQSNDDVVDNDDSEEEDGHDEYDDDDDDNASVSAKLQFYLREYDRILKVTFSAKGKPHATDQEEDLGSGPNAVSSTGTPLDYTKYPANRLHSYAFTCNRNASMGSWCTFVNGSLMPCTDWPIYA